MILKKAYIRDSINSSLVNLILKFFSFKHDGKVLVKSMDGIGDILVRSRLSEKIVERYGKDNVYFLMKEHYKGLGEMLGYNVIGIPRKSEKKFFRRLKLMYFINKKYSPKKFLNIEFGNDSTIANIYAEEKIGIYDPSEMVKKYNKYYTKSFNLSNSNEKVMEKIREIGENILNEKIELKDIIPDLRNKFQISEENIVIAVGSTDRSRVCSPLKMKEYIEVLKNKLPNDKIILVGNGELQKKYAETLISMLPGYNLIDMVDKTNLKEVFDIVAKSKIFIGFESGLYNFCFTLRKKGIALFKNTDVSFAHNVPWIKILGPDQKISTDFLNRGGEYINKEINSISCDSFKKALDELL